MMPAAQSEEAADPAEAMERGLTPAAGPPADSTQSSTGRTLRREVSLMEDVRARMDTLQGAVSKGYEAMDADPCRKSPMSPQTAALCATSSRRDTATSLEDAYQPRWRFSFRFAVIGAITLAVLLSCGGMFALLEFFTVRIQSETLSSCTHSVDVQRELISRLVYENVTVDYYTSLLKILTSKVRHFTKDPPDEAVDSLWNTMRTWRKFGSPVGGHGPDPVAYGAWAAISTQWQAPRGQVLDFGPSIILNSSSTPHLDYLFVAFESGRVTGARIGKKPCGSGLGNASWESSEPGSGAIACALEMAGNGSDTLNVWELDEGTGETFGLPHAISNLHYNVTERPFFRAQAALLAQAHSLPGGPASMLATRTWSEVYRFLDNQLGMSWTAPIAYCGNYSCFEGVIHADMSLSHVSDDLHDQWLQLKRVCLMPEFDFPISEQNSSIFVVDHVAGRHPSQQGLLVGSSHRALAMPGSDPVQAEESPQEVVRSTAQAIVKKFHAWNASALQGQLQRFTYRPSAMRQESPVLEPCSPSDVSRDQDPDCRRVATLSVALDDHLKWLVVVVLPVGAFVKETRENATIIEKKVEKIGERSQWWVRQARLAGTGICLGMTVLSVACGFGLGFLVSRPLLKLSKLMRRLGELDFAHESREFAELRLGRRSRVLDVGRLQNTFCSLSRGIEAFARFVPETVVRNIVHGDPRSTRLHVSRREVTIMFSDIQDFTSISETLSQRDLLCVLTRYLSVMTTIVELFDGVVAEILGDGLLAFWNTPDDVEDHAAKGCAAAMAMQQALVMLNVELGKLGLSELAIRIGVNTGCVLSGNIGSQTKMKFGCLGDPVNVASRLEGLCKFYGVGVICSGATHSQLTGSPGFFCRQLDLVQVKGKTETIEVYEVIGRESDATVGPNGDRDRSMSGSSGVRHSKDLITNEQRECAKTYEAALAAYQGAHFTAACELLTRLLEQAPDNLAARKLLQRAQRHAGPGGTTVGLSAAELAEWTGALAMDEK